MQIVMARLTPVCPTVILFLFLLNPITENKKHCPILKLINKALLPYK